jgi:hypothetical protein
MHTSSISSSALTLCRGLDVTLLNSPKLEFLEGHANQKHLGLTEEQYGKVRAESICCRSLGIC